MKDYKSLRFVVKRIRGGAFIKTLDRNSPIPLYYQLYSILLNQIREGDLKTGDMLPTELSLVDAYGVSRATVRQAIMDLARNGYVVREKSKGTFVKDNSKNVGYKEKIKGFSAISMENGAIPLSSKVLEQAVIIPPKFVSEALHLKENEKVFYLKRIRSIRDEPNTFVEDWLPYHICEGIEKENFAEVSLYDILEQKHGVIPHRAVRTFECCYADTKEKINELKINKNTALLGCTSYVYDEKDNPIEFYISISNGKYTVNE